MVSFRTAKPSRTLCCAAVLFAGAFCASMFFASTASAQSNLETNAGIQFNLSTPGAGNLALGGAYLALADDATTAFINPAGLTNIIDSEVHIEVRSWNFTHVFTDRGRLEGSPTDEGIDSISGIQAGEAEDDVAGFSFLSYVYPRQKWAIAFYRHEPANFEANFETQGAFLEKTRSRGPLGFPGLTDGRLASLRNTMTLRIVNHGVSAAYRLNSNFSLGFGISYHDFFIHSETERFLPLIFEEPEFTDDELASTQTQRGEGSDLSATIGIFWENADRRWSVGGVFRQGSDFKLDATSNPIRQTFPSIEPSDQETRFHLPDIYGVGIAFKPGKIRIAFDYDRVEYSDQLNDFVDIFNVEENLGISAELDSFEIDDADEFHLGFEYSFLPERPFFVRFGAWFDPDHTLHFEGDNPGLRAVYRRRGDEMHYTLGFGALIDRYQVNAALDFSERITTASISAVFRF